MMRKARGESIAVLQQMVYRGCSSFAVNEKFAIKVKHCSEVEHPSSILCFSDSCNAG